MQILMVLFSQVLRHIVHCIVISEKLLRKNGEKFWSYASGQKQTSENQMKPKLCFQFGWTSPFIRQPFENRDRYEFKVYIKCFMACLAVAGRSIKATTVVQLSPSDFPTVELHFCFTKDSSWQRCWLLVNIVSEHCLTLLSSVPRADNRETQQLASKLLS